jgi:hypothetical protein
MPEQYPQVYVDKHIYKDDFFDLKKVDFLQDFHIFAYIYRLALQAFCLIFFHPDISVQYLIIDYLNLHQLRQISFHLNYNYYLI